MSSNNIELVKEVIEELNANGVNVLLGGGWAEELLGLKKPWAHGDVDLYYVAQNFDLTDEYIAKNTIKLHKNKPHKRAFMHDGVQVEIILIQKDKSGYYSHYQNHSHIVKSKVIRWPADIEAITNTGIKCLSPAALKFKRSVHMKLFPESEYRF